MIAQPRLPYAARTLIKQVKATHPDAEVEQSGLDVLNVYRVIRFDAQTSDALLPALSEIADPERIADVDLEDDRLIITFTRTRHADMAHEFPIKVAADTASERVLAGGIADLKEWVGGSKARARQVRDSEARKDKPRVTLMEWLDSLLD